MREQNYDMNGLLYMLYRKLIATEDETEQRDYRALLQMARRAQATYEEMLAEAQRQGRALPDNDDDWLSHLKNDMPTDT